MTLGPLRKRVYKTGCFIIKDKQDTLGWSFLVTTRIVAIKPGWQRRTPPTDREMIDEQDVYLIRILQG